ncbi:MAG: DUF2752 domain-containing protein [Bacteroidota bacterium]
MNRFILTKLKWVRQHLELIGWVAALVVVFFLPVNKPETSLCVFSLLGFGHCPGCGIGHSMHYALHLQLITSFQHHPLGIFGVMVIFMRIKQLIIPKKISNETKPR